MKDENFTRLQDITLEQKLKLVDITGGSNGYPEPFLGYGLIGFDDFETAEAVAKELKIENLTSFHSSYGWYFWEEQGAALSPFSYDDKLRKMGDDYSFILPERIGEELDYWIERVCGDFNRTSPRAFVDGIKGHISGIEKLVDECENADEDEVVITYGGRYYETIKRTFMDYNYDGHRYAIGVFVPNNWEVKE